ncbi:MAG: acylneuraminate cytidylyltransferase [Kiritimatiellae bacterium]|nr:acylneuraminate cytidylyltransferase [Kiritimatiellia bacterium]MDD4735392.1 acylneuraminate cytidylyltransferase [Kiritimatiellia bacterium]
MKTLAIIPARGGSKGIPHKNIHPLAGRPLIAWTIDAALAAKRVDRVVVSTDDAEIADVARQWGAEVVLRPVEIAGDTASSESALLHVLETLRTDEQYVPDMLVFLQCTSPLTSAEDVDGTVERLLERGGDTALSVTPFHYFLWREEGAGQAEGINHDKALRLMRQEREAQYLETGAVYVMRAPGFLKAKHRFFGKTVMYEMPPERCLEIDEPSDLEVAEVRLNVPGRAHCAASLPERIGAVVFDFDGVLTDDRVMVGEDGCESVRCSRSDGMGISLLRRARPEIRLLVLSAEINGVVSARCKKLGIECLQGIEQKAGALQEWLRGQGVDASEVVYVGNDVNDLECMGLVGCGLAVSDAHPDVLNAANGVLPARGGRGAVRTLTDLILKR